MVPLYKESISHIEDRKDIWYFILREADNTETRKKKTILATYDISFLYEVLVFKSFACQVFD